MTPVHDDSSDQAHWIPENNDLTLPKNIRDERKEAFYSAASSSTAVPVSTSVKICWLLATLLLIFLVLFVAHSLLQTQSGSESLETKVLSGDKFESIKALKEQDNNFAILVMTIGMVSFFMLAGFGHLLYFKDTIQYEGEKRLEIVCTAMQHFDCDRDTIEKLRSNLRVQKNWRENQGGNRPTQ